jgi:hypothetical protein
MIAIRDVGMIFMIEDVHYLINHYANQHIITKFHLWVPFKISCGRTVGLRIQLHRADLQAQRNFFISSRQEIHQRNQKNLLQDHLNLLP